MPDFVAHVRQHLSRGNVPDGRYEQVVDELASELEARYSALGQQGVADEDAWREVLAQVPSWQALADALTAGVHAPLHDLAWLPRLWLVADRWRRDFVLGVRVLRKNRGFTATAVITLAVCLGGHAAIFAAVHSLLLQPLRVPEPERVLLMANQYPLVEARRAVVSATPDFEDRLRTVTVFEEQALYNLYSGTIDAAGVALRMRGMVATPSLFRLLRVQPVQGRIFAETEGTPGNDATIVLSDGLWRELFGADPSVIGRTLRVTGREHTIVGVLPRDFAFGGPEVRFWVPLALTDRQRSDDARHSNGWISIGRLKPGATIEQVRDQLTRLDAINLERTPAKLRPILERTGFYTSVDPLRDVMVRDVRGPLSLLWTAALAVLVIGIVNLGNIALARSRARINEVGTRLALGARRADVIRQLLVESSLIAAGGAAGGLAVGAWLLTSLDITQPGAAPLRIDLAVAALTVGLGILAGVVIGVVSASPLFSMSPGPMLHHGPRTGSQGRVLRATRQSLVIAQMACSFVLLVGSALLWVSVRNLLAVDPGFRTENMITGAVSLSDARFASDDRARAFVDESLAGIRQLPGVVAAGATTIVPLGGNYQSGIILAEGYVSAPGEPPVSAIRSVVTPGYFEAVGTRLLRGRYFDDRDNGPDSRAIVIDERLARRFWPHGDALGRRMLRPANPSELSAMDSPDARWLTVIGVVGNTRLNGPAFEESTRGLSGTFYLPHGVTAPRDLAYVIRTEGEPAGIVRGVRSVIARLDRGTPLFDVRTMSERTELALMSRTNTMRLAAVFAAVAAFLSAVGLYGVLAYLVTQRTREIGIRLAVGSTPRAIVGMVFREGLWLAGGGMALGAIGLVVLGRFLASQLYGVAPLDPPVMAVMVAVLTAIAALACVVPAHRASHVDVIRTLSAP